MDLSNNIRFFLTSTFTSLTFKEIFEKNRHLSPSQIHKIIEKLENRYDHQNSICGFDRKNKKSPCNYHVQDIEDPKFIRYVLDYCSEYENRGCVTQKPQLLKKLSKIEFKEIAFDIESDYTFD